MPNDAYYDAIRKADKALEDGLAAIRAREDARLVTPIEAAAERVELLEGHLAECKRLRRELL